MSLIVKVLYLTLQLCNFANFATCKVRMLSFSKNSVSFPKNSRQFFHYFPRLTSVRYKNPHGICVIRRAIFAEQKSESLYPDGKNLKNLCHLWEINNKIPCFPCVPCEIKVISNSR